LTPSTGVGEGLGEAIGGAGGRTGTAGGGTDRAGRGDGDGGAQGFSVVRADWAGR
jgi:hypothetical protein